MRLTYLLILTLGISTFANAQKTYKTLADTVKLNKEYLAVTNDIVSLKAKLEIAQNELPVLKTKAVNAHTTSKASALESSKQAAKAANAELEELKEADKKASVAYKDGLAAKSADDDVKDMEEKIAGLNEKIKAKQKRLTELESMRTTILSVIRVTPVIDSVPSTH